MLRKRFSYIVWCEYPDFSGLRSSVASLFYFCVKLQIFSNFLNINYSFFLIQSDIAINNDIFNYWRVGLRWDVFPKRLWPNRTVPYAISPLYEPEDMITIYQAIQTIGRITCLKFPKWNGKQKDFLLIWPIKYPKV
jgi:hypothetical protein